MDEFEELVRPHRAVALRVAYRITHNAADAEDAVQDAFVKAWRAFGRFRPGAPMRPWLLQIVANEARNRRRSVGRRERIERRAAVSAREEPLPIDSELLAALDDLPDEQRLVVAYRHLFSFTEEETAAALGIPVGTVKSRSARALARLRRAAVLLVIALAVAFAVPQSRGAILRFFDLGGVVVERVDVLPPAQERALSAGLGPVVSRAKAAQALGAEPIAPDVPLHLQGSVVSFLVSGPVLVSELRSEGGFLLKKVAGGSTDVEPVPHGLWLSGAPHLYLFPGEPARLAGNVLLVERGGLLLRLEAPGLTKSEAFRILTRIP
jgi:RNA polymerase sigma factor (sigma-70 family)